MFTTTAMNVMDCRLGKHGLNERFKHSLFAVAVKLLRSSAGDGTTSVMYDAPSLLELLLKFNDSHQCDLLMLWRFSSVHLEHFRVHAET